MLELVVLNPPRRGRKKTKMAKTKRKRKIARNPIVHAAGRSKGKTYKGFVDLPVTKQVSLINQGKVRITGKSPVTKTRQYFTKEGHKAMSPSLAKAIKLKGVRERTAMTAKAKKPKRKKATRKKAKRKKKATRKKAKRKTTRKKTTRKKAKRKPAKRKKTRKKAKRKPVAKKKTRKRRKKTRGYVRSTKRSKRTSKKRKRVTLKKGYRYPTKRKKALIKSGYLSKTGSVNPGRRRKKRKKRRKTRKSRRRVKGKRRRRRRNPALSVRSATSFGRKILKVGLSGVGAYIIHAYSSYAVGMVLDRLPVPAQIRSVANVAGSAATTALTYWAAKYVERKWTRGITGGWLSTSALVLGSFFTIAKAVQEFMPGSALGSALPALTTPSFLPGLSGMADWVELRGMGGMGMHNGHNYGSGMSDLLSPEALVAGESFARSVNEFSGMGEGPGLPGGMHYPGQYGMGDYRLAMSDIRGMGGMGDWVETITPGAPLNPGAESF